MKPGRGESKKQVGEGRFSTFRLLCAQVPVQGQWNECQTMGLFQELLRCPWNSLPVTGIRTITIYKDIKVESCLWVMPSLARTWMDFIYPARPMETPGTSWTGSSSPFINLSVNASPLFYIVKLFRLCSLHYNRVLLYVIMYWSCLFFSRFSNALTSWRLADSGETAPPRASLFLEIVKYHL